MSHGVRSRWDMAPASSSGPTETHERRAGQLLEIIAAMPGAHLRQLHRASGIPLGTTSRLLQRLESDRTIVAEEINTYRRYYPRGIHRRERVVLAHVATAKSRRVLEYLLDRPGASHGEISMTLDVPGPTLSYYLSRLEGDGVVVVNSRRQRRSYRLKNPDLVERARARWPREPPR